MENKKNTSITKTVELRNYAHWKELYSLIRVLQDANDPTFNAASLSYLFDFSNSILKDLEKLEE